jgi:hypothetical protein
VVDPVVRDDLRAFFIDRRELHSLELAVYAVQVHRREWDERDERYDQSSAFVDNFAGESC